MATWPANCGEVTLIPTSGPRAIIGAAAYIATLAFPKIADRDSFLAALWSSIQRGRDGKALLRDDGRHINKALRLIQTRRMPAGDAALALFPNGQHIGPFRFESAYSSITNLVDNADWLTELPKHRDRNNFLPQVWKDSWPVLHMAMAFNLQASKFMVGGPPSNYLFAWLSQRDWLLPALRVAADHLLELPRYVRGFETSSTVLLLPEEDDATCDIFKAAVRGRATIELPFSNVTL